MANGIVNVTKPFCYASGNWKNAKIIANDSNAMYGPFIVVTSGTFNVYNLNGGSNLYRLLGTTEQPTVTVNGNEINIATSSRYTHWLIILGGGLKDFSYVTFNND